MIGSRALAAACLLACAQSTWAVDYTFEKVIDTQAAVPGQPAANFTNFAIAGIDYGGLALIGTYHIGANSYSGLYKMNNGVMTPIADQSVAAPGGGTFNAIVGSQDFFDDTIVFGAATAQGQGVYRYHGGAVERVIGPNDPLPGTSATLASMAPKSVSGDTTDVAVGARLTDATPALYQTLAGSPMKLADDKTRAPGPELGNFTDFTELHTRNGKTAFVGTSRDADAGATISEPAGVFVSKPGNNVSAVAFRGMVIPGAPAGDEFRFNEFEKPRIDERNRLCFTGGFVEDDPTLPESHFMGVFAINPDGTWKEYGNSGQQFPGLHNTIREFNGYNFDGGVTLLGAEDMAGGTYIFLEQSDGVFVDLIDSYQMLDGKPLSAVKLALDASFLGNLNVRAVFADGSVGVYNATVPEPASIALLTIAPLLAMSRRRPSRR